MADITSNLALHVPFDNSLADLGSGGHTVTISSSTADYAAGKVGAAGLDIAANGRYAIVTDASDLTFGSGNADFTLSFWTKTAVTSTNQGVLSQYDADNNDIDFYINTSNNLQVIFRDAASAPTSNVNPGAVLLAADGNWHHFAIVMEYVSGTTWTVTIYKDGVVAHTQSVLNWTPTADTANLCIGARPGGSLVHGGQIDDVRAYVGRALTPGDISSIYSLGFDYDVYVILGQSNQKSYVEDPATIPDLSSTLSSGDVQDWDGTSLRDVSGSPPNQSTGAGIVGGAQGNYVSGTGYSDGDSNGGWHNQFCLDYYAATGHKLILIHYVVSGSYVTSGNVASNGNWTDGIMADAITEVDSALAAVETAHSGDWQFCGVIWNQGESDAGAVNTGTIDIADFTTDMSALIDDVDTAWGGIYTDNGTGYNKLFNFIRLGSQEAHENTREIPNPDSDGYEAVRDAQDGLGVSRSDTQTIAYDAKFFGSSGRMHDSNVHWAQEAHDDIGAAAASSLTVGVAATYPAGTAPSSLAAGTVTRLNTPLTWTAGASTAYQQRVEKKLTTDSEYTLVALVPATATSQYIASGTPGASYHVRVGSEQIDGKNIDYCSPITINVPADDASKTDISDYTTAFSDVSATAETHILQRLVALDAAGIGIGQGLKKLIVLRTDYQNNTVTAGALLGDVLRNGDLTAVGSSITGGDGFTFANGSYYTCASDKLLPHSGDMAVMCIYTDTSTPTADSTFFATGATIGKRISAIVNTSEAARWDWDGNWPHHGNSDKPSTSALGTNKSVLFQQEDAEETPYIYLDGAASPANAAVQYRRAYVSFERTSAARFAHNTNVNTQFKGTLKLYATWDRALDSTERAAAHTILSDLATGTAASEGGDEIIPPRKLSLSLGLGF